MQLKELEKEEQHEFTNSSKNTEPKQQIKKKNNGTQAKSRRFKKQL